MEFYKLDFNTNIQEQDYLYNHFTENTQFGNLNLIIVVKQNIESGSNKFFNSIKEVFFKVDGYNLDLYQRCLSQETYSTLYEELNTNVYELAPLFGVLDTRQIDEDEQFSIYFFDSR